MNIGSFMGPAGIIIFNSTGMSKRRDLRLRTNALLVNMSLDDRKMRNSSIFGVETAKSRHIPSAKRNSIQFQDKRGNSLQKTFNKNISFFRQSFNQNDPSQLPFMSSLRTGQNFRSADFKNMSTEFRPFEAGEKTTANSKTRKRISDLNAKGIRISKAYYRWHNQSGVNNKQSTLFECSLRDYNQAAESNPEQQNFFNLIKPIKYQDVEPSVYEDSALVCPRQKKLFCLNK